MVRDESQRLGTHKMAHGIVCEEHLVAVEIERFQDVTEGADIRLGEADLSRIEDGIKVSVEAQRPDFFWDRVRAVGQDRRHIPSISQGIDTDQQCVIDARHLTAPFLGCRRTSNAPAHDLDPLASSNLTRRHLLQQRRREGGCVNQTVGDPIAVLDASNMVRVEVAKHSIQVEEQGLDHTMILACDGLSQRLAHPCASDVAKTLDADIRTSFGGGPMGA